MTSTLGSPASTQALHEMAEEVGHLSWLGDIDPADADQARLGEPRLAEAGWGLGQLLWHCPCRNSTDICREIGFTGGCKKLLQGRLLLPEHACRAHAGRCNVSTAGRQEGFYLVEGCPAG